MEEKNQDKKKFKSFQHKECEYFPCHSTGNQDQFNCLFCFCPLYTIENCGGNAKKTETGIKDCSNCLVPHFSYDHVISKLKEYNELKK